ncbi:hypothetical protein F443_02112 [Phytophthora nicotianae P1569]|uniref:Uncharacterized protein n=1 Tax=Phytophthora nicotianae P1569 TaxID=1317065 RepID=V9FXN7_PHYNI|nr:hypothetical protein F443_02112 [Phytophthora nicotianae P1569]
MRDIPRPRKRTRLENEAEVHEQGAEDVNTSSDTAEFDSLTGDDDPALRTDVFQPPAGSQSFARPASAGKKKAKQHHLEGQVDKAIMHSQRELAAATMAQVEILKEQLQIAKRKVELMENQQREFNSSSGLIKTTSAKPPAFKASPNSATDISSSSTRAFTSADVAFNLPRHSVHECVQLLSAITWSLRGGVTIEKGDCTVGATAAPRIMTTKDNEYVDGESAVETPMNNATDEERSEVSQNAMMTEEMPRKQCEAVMNVQTDQDDENKSVKLGITIGVQKRRGHSRQETGSGCSSRQLS